MNMVEVGRGSLEQFKAAYDALVSVNIGKMWSQLYLAGTMISAEKTVNSYDWVIGYEVSDKPETVKQTKLVLEMD